MWTIGAVSVVRGRDDSDVWWVRARSQVARESTGEG